MSRLVCFVVDSSVSTGQSVGGLSALDAAKAACEHYLKKSSFFKLERVLLLSCAQGMSGVLCGWKDPPARLLEQIKSLKPQDGGDLGEKCFSFFFFCFSFFVLYSPPFFASFFRVCHSQGFRFVEYGAATERSGPFGSRTQTVESDAGARHCAH